MNWFAVSVKHNHELSVSEFLRERRIESFVPTYRSERRWTDRVKVLDVPLFSQYVLTRFDWNQRVPVLSTPGVRQILTVAGQPAPIPEIEIDAVRRMVASRAPVAPCAYVPPRVGELVRLMRGPLQGMEGTVIRESSGCKLVVSIPMLQRSIAATVDPGDVETAAMTGARSGAWDMAYQY